MSWDAMLTDEENTRRILQDHATDLIKLEDYAWRQYGIHRFGESFKQGFRVAVKLIIPWLLHLQRRVDDLTVAELCAELAKEAGSVYWPLFEADPKFPADCPSRAHTTGQILLDKSGVCPDCGYDFMEDS